VPSIQRIGFSPSVLQIRRIVLPPHAKVWEMVEDLAKDELAILSVSLGIEDMIVPVLVDFSGGNDAKIRIGASEREELDVFVMDGTGMLWRPTFPFFRILKLLFEESEIESGDVRSGNFLRLDIDAHNDRFRNDCPDFRFFFG
jgi:hypothetical protein